ncbi:MAG: diguanylate cyclase [Candidatus Gastranaerophilales bacterium]|nr:diguanylate cyclase [Candidatus Gastranaerophilales bacterium]
MDFNKTKNQNIIQNSQDGIVFGSTSNPIDTSKIMPLNARTSANRIYGGWANSIAKASDANYLEIISAINASVLNQKDTAELFYSIHKQICSKMNLDFLAVGIYNSASNYINVKLIEKTGSSYVSKVLLSDDDNIIVRAFKNKEAIFTSDSAYLKMNYFSKAPTIIIPLLAFGESIGVMIFSDNNNQLFEIYKLIANYYAIFYKNKQLADLVDKNTDTDSLTGLSNHKKLQEDLSREINKNIGTDKTTAFCIFDIANISNINNELGHAKGDEVIKEVANKIKKNVRNTDILGRYAGDEIAIIMPDTSESEAKYVCEFLLYNLACTMFDDLGQLKFSCGISMFPTSTNKQDKLTILAEQALFISKSKRAQSGQSEIVSTSDYNFWDDEALKCFAQVLTKKHATIGIDIEEELINQFHNENIVSNEHLLDVVSSLASTIDAKDTYTKGHSAAVSRYAEALARAINLPASEVERIKLGALLHDIGKIGIPEHVLRKPTMLSDDEWKIMKQHPAIGADKVLMPNKSLHDLIPMVKYHHEHIDGSGYPYGLKGDEIPLSARIVAVADAYHALISDRPYRKGLSVHKACEILKMGSGVQWDRELIRQFIIIAPSLATNI